MIKLRKIGNSLKVIDRGEILPYIGDDAWCVFGVEEKALIPNPKPKEEFHYLLFYKYIYCYSNRVSHLTYTI